MDDDNKSTNAGTGDVFGQLPSKLAPKQPELREIPVDRIRVSKYCKRRDYHDIDSLKRSIQKDGLIQFPAVTDAGKGFFRLVFGSRRYRAYKGSGKQTIPCHVIKATDEEAAVLSFVENIERKDLNPLEEARKLKQMGEKFGWKDAELGKRIGWSTAVVAERKAILLLDDDVLKKIGTGPDSAFKFTHALALSKLARKNRSSGKIEIEELQKKTIKHRLSSAELKSLVGLIRKQNYDRLPDSLRLYLLTSKYMASSMADLYLEPEKAISGNGKTADHRREMARKLDKDLLEGLLVKAVKGEWSYEKTCERLGDLVDLDSTSADGRQFRNETSYEKLLGDISVLHGRLTGSRREILQSIKSNPKETQTLCTAIEWLQSKLKPFVKSLRDALAQNVPAQGAKDKEKSNVSISKRR